MGPIRVMCVDDHHLIHEAIRSLLANEGSIELVAEGYAGEEIFPLIKQHQPDVLIRDLVMPQRRGWDPNERDIGRDNRRAPKRREGRGARAGVPDLVERRQETAGYREILILLPHRRPRCIHD